MMGYFSIYHKAYEGYMKELDILHQSDKLSIIVQINDRLNKANYQIVHRGKAIYNIESEDFLKRYKTMNARKFEKYDGGVCWDYVVYEANWFNKYMPDIKYDVFYFEMVDDITNPTHTFLIFYYEDKVYWFESSWKSNVGVYEFLNIDQALTHITTLLINSHPKNIPIKDTFIVKFDPLDRKLRGNNCVEYMTHMSEQEEFVYKYEKPIYVCKLNDTAYMKNLK